MSTTEALTDALKLMKKARLCYDCAKDGHLHDEDLDRWLRSKDYSTKEVCPRCSTVSFTKVFRKATGADAPSGDTAGKSEP